MDEGSISVPLTSADISLISVLSTVMVVTLIGNTLVIAAVATTRRLRTVTNFFVVSLAVADLLVATLVMPLAAVREVRNAWVFGSALCELWVSLDVMLCTASILNLCCISLDRYFAITSPMTYASKRSGRLAMLMVAGAWGLSALITCPPVLGWHEWDWASNSTECNYNNSKGYVVYSALGSFYIPAFVMVFVYCRIFIYARKREAVLMQGSNTSSQSSDSYVSAQGHQTAAEGEEPASPSGRATGIYVLSDLVVNQTTAVSQPTRLPSDPAHCVQPCPDGVVKSFMTNSLRVESCQDHSPSNHPHCQCRVAMKKRMSHTPQEDSEKKKQKEISYERAAFRRESRVARSLSLVVGGFVLCWLPFFIMYVMIPFCDTCVFHPVLKSSLVWLGWINSAINPFIYGLNSKDFKKAFERLTIAKCRPKRRTSHEEHDPRAFT